MSKLVKTFSACGLGLLLAGCGQTISGDCMSGVSAGPLQTRGFSTKCADNMAATTFVKSDRPELQAVGATMLRNQSPAVDRAFNDVGNGNGADAPVVKQEACVVVGITEDKRSGTKTAELSC